MIPRKILIPTFFVLVGLILFALVAMASSAQAQSWTTSCTVASTCPAGTFGVCDGGKFSCQPPNYYGQTSSTFTVTSPPVMVRDLMILTKRGQLVLIRAVPQCEVAASSLLVSPDVEKAQCEAR